MLRTNALTLALLFVIGGQVAMTGCGFASSSDASFSEAAGPSGARGTDSSQIPGSNAGETYDKLVENDFVETAKEPMSTFGVDVDTGSYSIMRRDITNGQLPNQDGVRPEEYINYFHYDYPQPTDEHPFSVNIDGAPSRFGENLHLVRIGLQGKTIPVEQRQRANLIFLVDVSGSMAAANKLPLVQYTLRQLVARLEPTDTLGIVTYAGRESVLIEPTPVTDKAKILDAIDGLASGGGTNGEGGIRKAYALAEQAKTQDSNNRVVLCTDGDFNVGATGQGLIDIIEAEREKGVTLTALGFGEGNYNDRDMEKLADHGNGNYAYIDNAGEANRVLGEKLVSTLQVIAKDVKIQIEFKPDAAVRYRLVGYENRLLANQDFRDDAKDAGEIGAGHSVTAFYEVELTQAATTGGLNSNSLATVRLRYKQPGGDLAKELERSLVVGSIAQTFDAAPADLRFGAGLVEYAEILRHSKHSQGARFDDVLGIVQGAANGHADRLELASLIGKAKASWK